MLKVRKIRYKYVIQICLQLQEFVKFNIFDLVITELLTTQTFKYRLTSQTRYKQRDTA